MEEPLKIEERLLCRLLAQALTPMQGESGETPGEVDWENLLQTAEKHKVLPLLYEALCEQPQLTVPQRERLRSKSVQTVQQNYRLLFLSRYVLQILEKNGVDAILLKGSGTAAYYPVPELRKSGDIDLLLPGKKEMQQALEVLKAQGFKESSQQNAHHHTVCISPDGISVELHHMLAEPFDNERTNRYLQTLLPEYFTHRSPCEVMGISFLLPDAPYHAFYLLLHMLQHFLRAGFGLKLLCDWVVFWEKPHTREEQEQFLQLVKESGLTGFARMITHVCAAYLGLPQERIAFLTAGESGDARLTEEFLKEIIEAEEFGKSGAERMVVLRGTKITDYMREFHHQMKLTYPRAGRYVPFYPFLWVMTLTGFLYRNRKLRNVSGAAILKKAGKRSRLTAQMDLFAKKDE